MSVDFRENLDRIIAVGWAGGVLKVVQVVSTATTGVIEIYPFDAEDNIDLSAPGSVFQKVLTGQTSGASVDLRALPVSSSGGSASPQLPSCQVIVDQVYAYPSGSAIPNGSAPWIGATIFSAGVPFPSVPARASIQAVSSYTPTGDPPDTCVSNDDRPALPGFILNETVIASDP